MNIVIGAVGVEIIHGIGCAESLVLRIMGDIYQSVCITTYLYGVLW